MKAPQIRIPMKCAALFLGFIKGPNVDDWVKLQTGEILAKYNWAVNQNDEVYWDDLFWDMASWKSAKEKLRNLTWILSDVNMFVTQFHILANQAEYPLDDHPTIMLFASKLSFKMMERILCNIRPPDFWGWADVACDYHQSNTAIQGLRMS
jgi:hypothetical protein